MPESINFSNDNFRCCVYTSLREYSRYFEPDRPPTIEEIKRIERLNLKDIDSLDDLKYFENLAGLTISAEMRLDLLPLLIIKDTLKYLSLDCEIEDDDISVINPIVSHLKELEIVGAHMWSIDNLCGSHSLQRLTLTNVRIKNLSVIKKFDNLRELEIDCEGMTLDISALSEYNFTLERLGLFCDVDDFEPLANNLALKSFHTTSYSQFQLAKIIDFHKIPELLKRRYDASITLAEYKQLHWFNLFKQADRSYCNEDMEHYIGRIIKETQKQENMQALKLRLESLGVVNDSAIE